MGAGMDAQIEGDTNGEVSGELAIPYASSPTISLYSLPGDGYNDDLCVFPLSPPPVMYVPAPPLSAHIPPAFSTVYGEEVPLVLTRPRGYEGIMLPLLLL
jgi:hypothetical protein